MHCPYARLGFSGQAKEHFFLDCEIVICYANK